MKRSLLLFMIGSVVVAGFATGLASASGRLSQSAGTAERSAIEGKWAVSYTEAEFVRVADYTEFNHPVNWGSFVLLLRGGRWTVTRDGANVTQGHRPSQPYSITGQLINFGRFSGPWIYRWSVKGDKLTFRKVPPGNRHEPTAFVVKAWQRVK
jgi:hypothetical protein